MTQAILDKLLIINRMQNKFHEDILAGIPAVLPEPKAYDTTVNHAPKRKEILSAEEKVLAIKNALRYFPQ